MTAPGAPVLLGRARERAALDGALEQVRAGESAALVVRGEAGIGKTAMLSYVAAAAAGCRVLQVVGAESELELPFAGLHQVCGPLLGVAEAVPAHQEQALRVALGLADGPPPDRFLVGLAVLSLLAEVGSTQPVVLLVDDAQWLDQETCQIVGVVARRLAAESVLMVFGVRETGEQRLFPGIADLTLSGLTKEEATALLTSTTAGHLDEQVLARLVAETGGNPLALLELAEG